MSGTSNLTQIGKLFFASCLVWIRGGKMNYKLKGTPEQVQLVGDILKIMKEYNDAINDPNTTMEQVFQKLEEKNRKIVDFKEKLNLDFPL